MDIVELHSVDDIIKLYSGENEENLDKIKNDFLLDLADAEIHNRIIVGLKHNGEIIGTAQLVFKMKKDFYADGVNRVYAHHIMVKAKWRNSGIGSRLMEIIENMGCFLPKYGIK